MLEFPSSSQVPTCVHPAPKRTNTPAVGEEEQRSDAEEGNAGTGSTFTLPQRALNVTQRRLEKTPKTQAVQRSLSVGTDWFPLTPQGWTEAQAHL